MSTIDTGKTTADERLDRLKAKCRMSNRSVAELRIADISAAGCMAERRALSMRQDDRVLIKLPGLEYRPAKVVWIDDDNAGIEFETLLYEPVLRRFQQMIEGPDLSSAA